MFDYMLNLFINSSHWFCRHLKGELPRFLHHSTQNKAAGKGKVFRVLQSAHAATWKQAQPQAMNRLKPYWLTPWGSWCLNSPESVSARTHTAPARSGQPIRNLQGGPPRTGSNGRIPIIIPKIPWKSCRKRWVSS